MDRRRARTAGVFFRSGGGRLVACLDGPAADETLTVDAGAGVYRYRVVSAGGAGAYTLGFSTG